MSKLFLIKEVGNTDVCFYHNHVEAFNYALDKCCKFIDGKMPGEIWTVTQYLDHNENTYALIHINHCQPFHDSFNIIVYGDRIEFKVSLSIHDCEYNYITNMYILR